MNHQTFALKKGYRKMTHSQLLPARLRRQSTPLIVNLAEEFLEGSTSSSHRATMCIFGRPFSEKISGDATDSDLGGSDQKLEEQVDCALDETE